MKIIFLGTNGWYDTETGNTICTLIKTEKYYVILDAGNGIYKIDDYCKKKKPAYLLLSHFHLDHIVGLHILNKIRCFSSLLIFGPKRTKKVLGNFINNPFTMPISQLPYPVKLFELPEDKNELPFSVKVKPLLHSSLTLGFRIEINGRIISYCPDTGYCGNAVELSKNADILIAECAYKKNLDSIKWPHLNPETAANIAKNSRAKNLILVHFDANLYRILEERQKAERIAKKIFKNTFAGIDGMSIDL
jgi:ribonuclease BN (tRNA processing enzyme)